ncbi:MAG: PIN domain-containing protein [Deltaproteobacteria bacterium]|nr:PIN domain-containing protein [Deltaproteobacteria bacterium]
MAAKYILDTNIYIHCMLDRSFALRHVDQYGRRLPSTFFSSVVAQELIVGCTDDLTVRRVQNFLRPFERVRRIVNPAYEEWKEAGYIAVKIRLKRPDFRSKKIALINDILIALSCRSIGAVLVTLNSQDFEVIRRFVRFRFKGF